MLGARQTLKNPPGQEACVNCFYTLFIHKNNFKS